MSYLTVVAILKAKPGCEEALGTMLQALIPPTLLEPGCIAYELHRSDDDPGTFLFNEKWESRAMLDAHLNAPHLVTFGQENQAVMESLTLFIGHRLTDH